MALYILVNIGSGNVLSPISCQIFTYTNADLLSTGTKDSEISIKVQSPHLKKIHLKMLSCNVLTLWYFTYDNSEWKQL